MRVLHLTTEFPPIIYGGLGTAVGGWVTACARAGVSVAVQLVEGRVTGPVPSIRRNWAMAETCPSFSPRGRTR
jgi:hypothetical protein